MQKNIGLTVFWYFSYVSFSYIYHTTKVHHIWSPHWLWRIYFS